MVDVTQPKQVGTTPDNQPIFEFTVPRHTAGWDANFGAPGEDGRNVSLAGHVFRFFNDPSTTFDEAKIPAPFAQLKKLQGQKGVDAYVDTIDGMTFHYTLSQDFWAVPDQADLLFDDGQTKLTLVSCIGEQTDQSRADDVELSHRLILIFVPAK